MAFLHLAHHPVSRESGHAEECLNAGSEKHARKGKLKVI